MCLEFAFKRGGIGILKNFMVFQKELYQMMLKKDLMLVFKLENIIKVNGKNKNLIMQETLLNLLNNYIFEYNLFIMNIFAFYLALQYIKIIGDFANKPDAFDDPTILKMLEQEVSDDPISKQGFLSQVYLQQEKIAQGLQFEFEKIQKQQLIKKYSEKGLYNSEYLQSSNKNYSTTQTQQPKTFSKRVAQKSKIEQNQNVQKNTQTNNEQKQQNISKKDNQSQQVDQQQKQSQQKIKQNQKTNTQQQNAKNENSKQPTQTTQNNNQQKTQQDVQKQTQQKPQENTKNSSQQKIQNNQKSNTEQQNQNEQKIQTQQTQKTESQETTNHLKSMNLLGSKKQHKTTTSTQTQTQPQQTTKTQSTTTSTETQPKQTPTQTQPIQDTTKTQSTQTNQPKTQDQNIQTSQPIPETQNKETQKEQQTTIVQDLSAIKTSTKNALKKATDVIVKVIALTFILASLSVYILMVIFGHKLILQEIQSGIANGYTEFIEKQQEVKTLQKEMKDLLNRLYWRSVRSQKEGDILFYNEQGVETESEYAGQRYSFNITVPLNSTFTLVKIPEQKKLKKKMVGPLQILVPENQDIVGFKDVQLFDVKSGPQFLYYEIQIDYLHDKTDFILGFTSKKLLKEMQNDYMPGVSDNSYGFRVKTGEILNNGNIVYTFNMLEEILNIYDMDDSKNFDFNGSFFGIGVSITTKEFFFSYNGRILNSLSFQTTGEIRFQIFNKKRKDELEADFYLHKQDKINRVAKALKLEKNQREEIKKNPTFKSKLHSYVPVIYVNGISKFYVNIGGYPLQLKERQIRTGLLKKDIMK